MRSFEIYGKWLVQRNEPTSIHRYTHTHVLNAVVMLVGLAQARPTKRTVTRLQGLDLLTKPQEPCKPQGQ